MTERDLYAAAGHPSSQTPTAHEWGPPAPGSGSMQICKRCGAKETVNSVDPQHPASACDGLHPTAHNTHHSYEPIV